MAIGRLYSFVDGELVGEVEYKLHHESQTSWWGELILVEYQRISDGAGYIIELEDKRHGRCSLKKRVNRAVSGVPPRYVYHFAGNGLLASDSGEGQPSQEQ